MSLQRLSGSEERSIDRDTMRELVRDLNVHRVMIATSQTNPQVTLDLVRAAKAAGVRVASCRTSSTSSATRSCSTTSTG